MLELVCSDDLAGRRNRGDARAKRLFDQRHIGVSRRFRPAHRAVNPRAAGRVCTTHDASTCGWTPARAVKSRPARSGRGLEVGFLEHDHMRVGGRLIVAQRNTADLAFAISGRQRQKARGLAVSGSMNTSPARTSASLTDYLRIARNLSQRQFAAYPRHGQTPCTSERSRARLSRLSNTVASRAEPAPCLRPDAGALLHAGALPRPYTIEHRRPIPWLQLRRHPRRIEYRKASGPKFHASANEAPCSSSFSASRK